jgi:hypothetical protein
MRIDLIIQPTKFVISTLAALCFLNTLPPIASAQNLTPNNNLTTQTGHEFGVSLSNYKYSEPGVMNIDANKLGLEYSGTYSLDPEWPNQNKGLFLKTELRYVTGQANYNSVATGSLNSRPDWYYEARILGGRDYSYGDSIISPYLGISYRYLFNDLRGTTTTGNVGYRRESNYYSLPIGLSHKMSLSNQKQLQTIIEYSYLIRGLQNTKLSDANASANTALADISNNQRSGYGFRLSSMLRFDRWAIGPSLIYWRINQSEQVTSGGKNYIEPQNNTTELGLKANYLF